MEIVLILAAFIGGCVFMWFFKNALAKDIDLLHAKVDSVLTAVKSKPAA